MREEDYIYVETLPANPQDFKRRTVVLSDGSKFYSDGNLWLSETGGGSATLDANSPIPGNPTTLNTPAKLAAAIQALQGFDASLDADGDGDVDANKQQDKPFQFLSPLAVWTIPHNLGRRPAFELFDLSNNALDEPPREDPTANITIFRWLIPQAGTAIAI